MFLFCTASARPSFLRGTRGEQKGEIMQMQEPMGHGLLAIDGKNYREIKAKIGKWRTLMFFSRSDFRCLLLRRALDLL